MTYQTLFKEYVWMVNTIAQHRRISLQELNALWVKTDMSGGVDMARSTFNRHKDAIEDIFGIYIECDRKNGYKYYIGNAHVLENDSIQNWMLSTMTVNNLLTEHKALHSRVLLEQVPSAERFLDEVMRAMRENVKVSMFYQKYSDEPGRERTVAPYCVKLYKRRWYVLGRTDEGGMRLFSLDRVMRLSLTKETFELPNDFDAEAYFRDVIGVMTDTDIARQRIVVRAYDREPYYLRDLPMHGSQQEVGRGEGYVDFAYDLVPTSDFVRLLFSRGGMQKVLEPEWLAQRLRDMYRYAAEKYEVDVK